MKLRFILLLSVAGAFSSCKKQNGNIVIDGQGQGSELELYITDTFSLKTVTIREDSLPGNGLAYSLLGEMNDPLLGTSKAAVYSELALYEPSSDFPNTLTPDSAILYIPLVDGLNFYGNKATYQKLGIYPLLSTLDGTKVYYQKEKPVVDENLSTQYIGPVYASNGDSIRYNKGKIKLNPGLRIKLSAEMAKMLMQLPKTAYASNEGLKSSLKGLGIIPENNGFFAGEGGIGVYDLINAPSFAYRAKVMLYYSDTNTFTFIFKSKSTTLTGSTIGTHPAMVQTQLADSSQTFTMTYAQGLGGLKTQIQIPYLLNLLNEGNVVINRAELILVPDQTDVTDKYPVPPRINLFQPASGKSKRNSLLPDASATTFGGIYNAAAKNYSFNITRWMQAALNAQFQDGKNINYGLYVTIPTGEPVLAARVAFDHTKTKLKITYTKLN